MNECLYLQRQAHMTVPLPYFLRMDGFSKLNTPWNWLTEELQSWAYVALKVWFWGLRKMLSPLKKLNTHGRFSELMTMLERP
jgi:hypothetical protein